MNNQTCSVNNIYQLNGRVPAAKAIPFGLQHFHFLVLPKDMDVNKIGE